MQCSKHVAILVHAVYISSDQGKIFPGKIMYGIGSLGLTQLRCIMIESLYAFLAKIGFTHPLHPAFTHIPMGMVMGCFFFGFIAWNRKKEEFHKTCLHCSTLAFLFTVPTIIAGIFDWQHLYGGRYLPLIIIKMVLAAILVGLLGYSLVLNRQNNNPRKLFFIYALCLGCAIGLGFSGGQLIFGG